jgi:hypothetical protein
MKQSPYETSSLSASQDILRILCSREPAVCPYPGPDYSSPRFPPSYVFKIRLTIPSTPRFSKWFFLIEDIPLCLMIYKVNRLFIVAVKHNNIIFSS